MTISEQIREAALYSAYPEDELLFSAWGATCGFWCIHETEQGWRSVTDRTFMLLVAEALE